MQFLQGNVPNFSRQRRLSAYRDNTTETCLRLVAGFPVLRVEDPRNVQTSRGNPRLVPACALEYTNSAASEDEKHFSCHTSCA